MRRAVLALMLLSACAHKVPPPEPWEQWAKPDGTEEQRAGDYAECKGQGQALGAGSVPLQEGIYRACMVARGWRLSDEPGSPDREVAPNYGH